MDVAPRKKKKALKPRSRSESEKSKIVMAQLTRSLLEAMTPFKS